MSKNQIIVDLECNHSYKPKILTLVNRLKFDRNNSDRATGKKSSKTASLPEQKSPWLYLPLTKCSRIY